MKGEEYESIVSEILTDRSLLSRSITVAGLKSIKAKFGHKYGQEGAEFAQNVIAIMESIAKHLVLSIHGIRTRGAWQKDLTDDLNRFGLYHRPLDYGFFSGIQLVTTWARRRQVEWFLKQYTQTKEKYPQHTISIVAHSFGTYLVARAMEKYPEVRFHRIIFCGSIVVPTYSWTTRSKSGQVDSVLNDYGRLDIWSRLVAWFASDCGQSGLRGFDDDGGGCVVQRDHPNFRHSDYFYTLNYTSNWIPFLIGQTPPSILPEPRHPTNWRFVATVVILSIAILALGLWLLLAYR